jgi:acyl dehydratase
VIDYQVRAHNMATASANKIHDDAVARAYGFEGGLVPGVEVYAYMTHPVVEHFGRAWLEGGDMHARFVRPVYDGRVARVTSTHTDGALVLALLDDDGTLCAEGSASVPAVRSAMPILDEYAVTPLPEPRPPASAEVLSACEHLGTVTKRFESDAAAQYLDGVGERLPIYRADGIAHPGWLLRRANRLLAVNVELGPWIHVESAVRNFGVVHDGEVVSTRGKVTRVWERSGHKFVLLDVVVAVEDRLVMHVDHTAIYEPRRHRSA